MQLPKVKACILCEDVRPELGNKLSILGFYGLLPDVQIVTSDISKPLTRLSLLVVMGEAEGQFSLHVDLLRPDGKIDSQLAQVDAQFKKGERANMAVGLNNFTPQVAGKFTIVVAANKKKIYEESFSIAAAASK